ncbi:MAG: YdcF family protein [Erythrobacter sp.]
MKVALRLTGFVLAWFALIAGWIWFGPAESSEDSADAAIVLGAGVIGDQPTPVFAARIDHAIALHNAGRVEKIIFTGGKSPDDELSEAASARKYAIARGINADAILIEEQSGSTRANLVEAKVILETEKLSDALIVSDPLHLRRASLMAAELKIDAATSAAPTSRYQSFSTQLPFLLREVYFTHYFWILGE